MKKWEIILGPVLTEKSNDLIENHNQYVFKVAKQANKVEIKNAVEEIFNVKVLDVKTIQVLPKYRKVGRYEGYRPAYKKAICRLEAGQKIDAFNV
jgi:large subunit ribosomal protein L23